MLDAALMRMAGQIADQRREVERQRVEVAKAPILRLNFVASGDALGGGAASGTAYDLIAAQNFVVGSATSIMVIAVSGSMLVQANVGGFGSISLYIDSTTRYLLGAENIDATGSYANPFSGVSPLILTGLSAATHTVRVQVIPTGAGLAVYFRPGTQPNTEFMRLAVLEIPQ